MRSCRNVKSEVRLSACRIISRSGSIPKPSPPPSHPLVSSFDPPKRDTHTHKKKTNKTSSVLSKKRRLRSSSSRCSSDDATESFFWGPNCFDDIEADLFNGLFGFILQDGADGRWITRTAKAGSGRARSDVTMQTDARSLSLSLPPPLPLSLSFPLSLSLSHHQNQNDPPSLPLRPGEASTADVATLSSITLLITPLFSMLH